MPSLTITTGSRLHFGLLVRGEPRCRSYGGIGLMIDQPGFSLTVRRSERTRIEAQPETRRRIERLLSELRTDSGWEIDVREEIPAHAGLGSGTQLGLSVASAVSRLRGESAVTVQELARRVGRGGRSIVGTIGFETGGLIAHGMSEPTGDEPDIMRLDFPAPWRSVIVTPTEAAGLSGAAESAAFRDLPPMDDSQLARLRRLSQQFLTAIDACDFATASGTLFEYGRLVGEYFAPIQGGVFAHPRMTLLAEKLRTGGITGVGQTSWGPTLFALCDSAAMAQSVAAEIRRSSWSDCEVRIASAKNDGAEIIESKS